MHEDRPRRITLVCFVALIVLGLAWELWLAPLPGGRGLLALKVLPLVLALPAIAAGRLRAYQWWSMLILLYQAEAVVRILGDTGPAVWLAAIEFGLATAAYAAILMHVRALRRR